LAAVLQQRALRLDLLLRRYVEDEGDHLVVALVEERDADQRRNLGSVLAPAEPLVDRRRAAPAQVGLERLERRDHPQVERSRREVLARVAEQAEERVVGVLD